MKRRSDVINASDRRYSAPNDGDPEVAQGLLQIQQAQAKLEARKIVVEGGVGIVKDALDLLDAHGIKVSPEGREKIVSNLLVNIILIIGQNTNNLKCI